MLFAQETTGSIQGYIIDSNGSSVEFVNILLIDKATNSISGGISQHNGFYSIPNLTPSVYQMEISYIGYHTIEEQLQISLGITEQKDFTLLSDNLELDAVVVRGKKLVKNGNETYVAQQLIEQTPTLFRSIQELTRSLPENNLNSFGGASHRFNNLNIDGVAANDVIGFQEPSSGAAGSQANGTPGSLAKTQPIGLGAIKELVVKLTPFDVSIGNFNGANIDIITKNGTNKSSHSFFAYGNNQSTLGNFVEGTLQNKANFHDYQIGLNSGGAIKQDKIFYFFNVEYANAQTPLTAIPGTDASNISKEDVLSVQTFLSEHYDYDPGAFEVADIGTSSTKVFTRLDFNLNKKHKLTIRNNFVNSFADNLEWNANFFNFGNQGFRHKSVANSTVVELKSNFNTIFNKLNIGYNIVEEGRTFDGRIFPHIQIATSSSSRVFAGTYREASVFNTRFNTFQISDKISYVKGSHHLSGGILLQLHDVNYGFLSAWNGRWEYKSLADFLNEKPSRVRGVYNINLANNNFDYIQNNPAATIGVFESAIYAQDKFNINKQLEITTGVRVDGQFLTQQLPISSLLSEDTNFSHFTNKLNNNFQINPRLSFSYRLPKSNLTIRGGTGFFSGKLPYLWFAYMEYISGTTYFNIDLKPSESLPLTEDLGSLQNIQPSLTEVNVLNPDFKFPRDWKTNIGVDWEPNSNWKLGLEFSYTDVLQGLFFQTANRNEIFSNFNGADSRLYYNTNGAPTKINSNFTNVFVLSNTTKGFRYNISFNLERKSEHLYTSFGYSYGVSKDVSSTVRSSPAANYEWNQALLGNAPDLSFSNYDLRHKFIVVQSFNQTLTKRSSLQLSFLYNGRSGSPYSIVYQGDLNQDGSSRNDLVYIPQNKNEIVLVDIIGSDGNVITSETQWQQLDNYINSIGYLNKRRGNYAERNGAKTPWNHQLDLKLALKKELPNGKNVSLSLDIFNALNLLNRNWGRLVYVPNVVNSSFSLLQFQGIENNIPQFSFNIPAEQTPWVVDNFNSRWRMQAGVKFDF